MTIRSSLLASVTTAVLCVTAAGQQPSQALPISMGIVLDTSGSMGHKMAQARQVVAELLKAAGPLDEFALIRAADRPVVVSGFAAAEDAQERMAFIQSKGRSSLLDGVYLGLQLTKTGRHARKILLVISDGGDNSSRYAMAEVKEAIPEAGVRLFVIGINESAAASARTAEEVSGPALLSKIADHRGGRHVAIEAGSNIPQAALELSAAMRR